MIQRLFKTNFRAAVLGSTALAALVPAAAQAQSGAEGVTNAASAPEFSIHEPGVVVNDGVGINTPASQGGAFDNTVNLTGVGQMGVDQGGGFVGTCTGSLINPRTVIFAAHCVNSRAATAYGSNTGGTAISFGFNAYNLAALRRYLGLDGGAYGQTDQAFNIYNVEQVWYDPRSLDVTIGGAGFIQADVALATLDTPATDIPTWALLFSPLTGETHATINGYGGRGNGSTGSIGVDFRRRIAENMISALASLNDVDEILYGERDPALGNAAVYYADFDSPNGEAGYGQAGASRYDFDVFDGRALPNEGITAGGDSGGPLIVDQKYAIDVIAGVLSGGTRYFVAQPGSSYGTSSFYQPLHLYWDVIVANNPYVYASNRGGNKNWSDPTNWVQNMDPAYMIDIGGQLVNALPGTPAGGVGDGGTRFGRVCFLTNCGTISSSDAPAGGTRGGRGSGTVPPPNSIQIPGGPGSLNFVPNNSTFNPNTGTKSRYYDVTLGAFGTTTVNGNFTIDKLTMSQANAGLTIAGTRSLTVLGDYTQTNGTLNIAAGGLLDTGEAMLFQGNLLGGGTFDAPAVTMMFVNLLPGDTALLAPAVRPRNELALGNDRIGTLSFGGDLVMTSATTTWINLARNNSDLIAVADEASVGGRVVVRPNANVRFDTDYTILTAAGGVSGTFNTLVGGSAVLSLTATYNANDVQLRINAAPIASVAAAPTATALAFANALDGLRASSYADLYSVYSLVDYLDPKGISMALDAMAPRIVNEAAMMDRDQGRVTLELVGDRLSVMGTQQANMGRLTVVGSPEALASMAGQTEISGSTAAQLSFASALTPQGRVAGKLPANVSGFLAGGYTSQPGAGDTSRSGWHMAMGLEMEAAPQTTLGTAFAYSRGTSRLGGSMADADTSQAMVYGSHQLGGGAYVGALASTSHTKLGVQRGAAGFDMGMLRGNATAMSYSVRGEIGVNMAPVAGLTLTPRASVSYEGSTLADYRERGGAFGLIVDDLSDQRLVGRVGAKLSGSVGGKAGGWKLVPEARVDWVQTLAGGTSTYDVRFAAAPDLAIALPFASQDASWGEVKAGLSLTKDRMGITAGVESSVARDNYRDDRAVASFSLRF